MLDYILSRLVLLSFLILILGVVIAYKDFLGEYFLSGAAKSLAMNLGERIRSMALNLTTASDNQIIKLDPELQAGPVRMPYNLVFGCSTDDSKKTVYIGIGVKSKRGNLLYAYAVPIHLPGKNITVVVPNPQKVAIHPPGAIKVKKNQNLKNVSIEIDLCKDLACTGTKDLSGSMTICRVQSQ